MMTFLVGRTTPGIQRVNDTVHRPIGPRSGFVHKVLQHLERRGFTGAPRYLGVNAGAEILSFLAGDVPRELGAFSTAQLIAAARLLRQLHDATIGFDGLGVHEIVCHGDASPCNTVFRDGLPIGFIDFDSAHIGARRDDVGYAAWLWLDLGDSDPDPIAQGRRLRQFIDAYEAFDCLDAIPAIMDAQSELSQRTGAPTSTREWAGQCRHWTAVNRTALSAGLASSRHAS